MYLIFRIQAPSVSWQFDGRNGSIYKVREFTQYKSYVILLLTNEFRV